MPRTSLWVLHEGGGRGLGGQGRAPAASCGLHVPGGSCREGAGGRGAHRVSGGSAPPPALPQQNKRVSGRDLAALSPPTPACAHHASTVQAYHPARHTSDSDATGSWAGNVHLSGSLGRGLSVCVSVLERCSARPPRPRWNLDARPPRPAERTKQSTGPASRVPPRDRPGGRRPSGEMSSGPAGGQARGAALLTAQRLHWNSGHTGRRHRTLCQAPFLRRSCAIASSWGKSRRNRLPPASYLP